MKRRTLSDVFRGEFSGLTSGSPYLFDGFHCDLLPSFLRAISGSVLCVVGDNQIASFYNYFPSMEDGLVFIPPAESKEPAPPGFRSEGSGHLLRSSGLLAGGIGAVSAIISSETGMSMPIVGGDGANHIVLGSGVGFDACVDFFKRNGYSLSAVVMGAGDYCIRGGIVDIFPFSSSRPIRINFLAGAVSLYFFDIDSQLTADPISSFTIFSTSNNDLLAMKDVARSKFVTIYTGIDGCFDSLPYKKIGFLQSFSLVGLEKFEFYSNNNKINIYEDDLLSSVGVLCFDRDLYIPSWFLNKRPKTFVPVDRAATPPVLNTSALRRGDFVVHRDHGVGACLGLAVGDDGVQEFLVIQYGDGGVVRLDTARLGLVSFFARRETGGVVLDSLKDRRSWAKKRSSALRQAEEAIDQLIDLYVRRKNIFRRPFVCDDTAERDFIDAFPFTDTEDQAAAWKYISADLASSSPMDRLLCGDVGFGKTELAIRAAFRVVYGGGRVLVLAPTTILAGQLFASFKSRLDPCAVVVDVISRFRTRAQVSKIKQNILAEKNDVLIGTHSVLNDDIYLNNIGLLIIDEEHRFGVAQKERVRIVKKSVDVLSMSATPIPRSINMALSEIYSISLLQTPPIMRRPITTRVGFYNDDLIYNAISFEVSRGGQIYFVHNNLQSIASITTKLQNMFPILNIVYLHGKDPPKKIETNMLSFIRGDIHVLVCSSIIEAGIDVSNANCIIINNAHLFGLSQLYQMRGRVGRGYRSAQAYLLIPRGIDLSVESFRRIKTIENNTQLGSGYNISRADMEIRGSGSIFGYRQSGGAVSVGYEMYLKLIQQALHVSGKLSSKFKVLPDDVLVDIYSSRGIPETYIDNEGLRISFYKDLASSSSVDKINVLENILKNRFGPVPSVLGCFINECRLKILASDRGIISIKNKGCGLVLQISINAMGGCGRAVVDYVYSYFTNTKVDFHFLPNTSEAVFVCLHVSRGVDKYIILFQFLNKFRM